MRVVTSIALIALLVLGVVALAAVSPSSRQDVPQLDKATAAKIITFMGWKDVSIGAIYELTGSQWVIGVGDRRGAGDAFQYGFNYDSDLGWFFSEVQDATPHFGSRPDEPWVRLWTENGYKEIKPKSPPAVPSTRPN